MARLSPRLVLGFAGLIGIALLAWPPRCSHAATDMDGGTDGIPGDAALADRTIRIEAHGMSFRPRLIPVRAGETVRLMIVNRGTQRHEFVIASHAEHLEHRATMRQMPDMDMSKEPNAVTVDPGQTRELIWKFGKDPHVEFSCDIPGHAEAGMTGTFIVRSGRDDALGGASKE